MLYESISLTTVLRQPSRLAAQCDVSERRFSAQIYNDRTALSAPTSPLLKERAREKGDE